MVIISPYDKGASPAIEKAIRDSDLGVNPTNDGNVIRVVLPQLTEERRKEYIKLAKTKAEDARVVGPQHPPRTPRRRWTSPRRTARPARTTSGAEKELDGLTKKHVDHIDELLKHKEAGAARGLMSAPDVPGSATAARRAQPAVPRSGVGVGLAAAVLLSLFFVKALFVVVVLAAAAVAIWELSGALGKAGIAVPLPPLLAGGLAILAAAYVGGTEAVAFGTALTVLGIFVWRMPDGADGFVRDVSAAVFIVGVRPRSWGRSSSSCPRRTTARGASSRSSW